jgi:hypothetical protein
MVFVATNNAPFVAINSLSGRVLEKFFFGITDNHFYRYAPLLDVGKLSNDIFISQPGDR